MTASELPELIELERIIIREGCRPPRSARVLPGGYRGTAIPVYAITLGNPGIDVTAVGFFAIGE